MTKSRLNKSLIAFTDFQAFGDFASATLYPPANLINLKRVDKLVLLIVNAKSTKLRKETCILCANDV